MSWLLLHGGGRILLIASLLAVALPVAAQNWVKIYSDSTNNIYYLDRRSIEDHGSYVMGWVRSEMNDFPVAFMLLYGAQKGSRQVKLFQMNSYMDGKLITAFGEQELRQAAIETGNSRVGQWQYCPPGELYEKIWRALMEAAGIRY